MYCEKCGKKLNPGERCSCENDGARSSVERSDKEKKNSIEKIPKKTEIKKSGGKQEEWHLQLLELWFLNGEWKKHSFHNIFVTK